MLLVWLYMAMWDAPALKLIGLRAKNFKGAASLSFELQDLTTLVGVNGSGKTTILEALDIFFNNPEIPETDYGNKNDPITITVRFIDVPNKNRPVAITRRWKLKKGKSVLREMPTEGLGWADREKMLDSVHVIFERAEHETDNDGTDASDLELVRMIKRATRRTITADSAADLNSQLKSHFEDQEDNIAKFKKQVNRKLRGSPTDTCGYAPDAEVHFSLERPSLEPRVSTKFVESGVRLEHRSVGHGTKRAFHMAAMEAFAEMSPKTGSRLLLLLVDEPELHQHPQRQRRILQTYKRLSKQPNFQVIYSTHSQEFVDLGELHGLYRISRDKNSNTVATLAPELPDKVRRWNTARKLVEGLFSAGVVLVEGWEDQAILDGVFSATRIGNKTLMKTFIENDINIINCHGIDNMPEFARFFKGLGIPLFAVWDADGKDSGFEKNQKILDAVGEKATFAARPCSECNFGKKFVCFSCDACVYFKERFGYLAADDDPGIKHKIKDKIKEMEDLRPLFRTPEFEASDFAAKTTLFYKRFFPSA